MVQLYKIIALDKMSASVNKLFSPKTMPPHPPPPADIFAPPGIKQNLVLYHLFGLYWPSCFNLPSQLRFPLCRICCLSSFFFHIFLLLSLILFHFFLQNDNGRFSPRDGDYFPIYKPLLYVIKLLDTVLSGSNAVLRIQSKRE